MDSRKGSAVRLQILNLPCSSDRHDFAVILDSTTAEEVAALAAGSFDPMAEELGAKCVVMMPPGVVVEVA